MRLVALIVVLLASSFHAGASEFRCRQLSQKQASVIGQLTDEQFERVIQTCRTQAQELREKRDFATASQTNTFLLMALILRAKRVDSEPRPVSR